MLKDNVPEISYEYDNNGNISEVSYAGVQTEYTYDSQNRLKTVRGVGAGADYTYDASGNVTEITTLDGTTSQMSYNKNNKVTALRNTSGTNEISEYLYSYDAAGRITSKTDPTGTSTYTYDASGRLTKAVMPSVTNEYEYDASGNRTKLTEYGYSESSEKGYAKRTVDYAYSVNNELVSEKENMYDAAETFLSGTITDYTYDANGNQYMVNVLSVSPGLGQSESMELTQGSGGDLTISEFDGFNNLTKITKMQGDNITEASYKYNPDGKRIEKTSGGGGENVKYLYDGSYVVSETRGSQTTNYLRGLDYIAKIGTSNQVSYYMYNGHGDVVQTISGGTVKNRYEYDPFGETLLSEETEANSIKYAGEFYDEEAGLYYLSSRYYNPGTGRFISRDSYTGDEYLPQSLNLYAYCYNDPINHVDPTGHSPAPNDPGPNSNNTYIPGYNQSGNGTTFWQWVSSSNTGGLSPDIVYNSLYTLSKSADPSDYASAGEFLTNLYLNDIEMAVDFVRYYVNQIQQEKGYESAINLNMPDNVYQMLLDAWDNRPPAEKPSSGNYEGDPTVYNRYSNYKYNIFDALNWMIQTGGNVEFVLQVRDLQNLTYTNSNNDNRVEFDSWLAIEIAAEKQANIIKNFTMAYDLLTMANQPVQMPGFYIGALETKPETLLNIYNEDGSLAHKGVYDLVIEKLGGDDSMISGAYYGEDVDVDFNADSDERKEKNEQTLKELETIAKFIHEERGKNTLWIPYFTDENIIDKASQIAKMTHDAEWGERPFFDTILIQPGTYFYDFRDGSEINDIIDKVEEYDNNRKISSVMGIQFEFDMGLVTGRSDDKYVLSNTQKKVRLEYYFNNVVPLMGSDIPIGIYSGGPNEQGYNNIFENVNRHNTGNHLVQKEDDEDNKNPNGRPYADFKNAYSGNLIYDINDYLFDRTGMSSKLKEFLGY